MATDKGMTVGQLMEECKKMVKAGYGDRHIQISCDDEGNGFHSLFYTFLYDADDLQVLLDEGLMSYGINNVDDIIVLG